MSADLAEHHDRPRGLTEAEVSERRSAVGENRLPSERQNSATAILLRQFRSPLAAVILVAAVVSLILGEVVDSVIIFVVLVLNVALGFAQEYRAQRMYQALTGLLTPKATVIREGHEHEIEATDLVPGDLVALRAGDKIPADGDVLEARRLSVDEAVLTGESEPVTKKAVSAAPLEASAADDSARATRVFMGCTVISGRALMRVSTTGSRTELGEIASTLNRREAPTPLQARLAGLARLLTVIVLSATAVIMALGLLLGREFIDMLRSAMSLAIAAVPEGLVIAVTVVLVLGAQRILRRRGLVKRLLAVESLGSVTVICTDKTGTLTQGRMSVNRTSMLDEQRAWQTMALCNNLEGPVEIALWDHAENDSGKDAQGLVDRTERLSEALFSSESKYMTVKVAGDDFAGDHPCFLKGAPEIVLEMSALADDERARILAEIDAWAREGLRVLGLAYRDGGSVDDTTGFHWSGMVGLEDPVRPGVAESVRLAHSAGVRVKMVTGDYVGTAETKAAQVGITGEGPALEGAQIAAMTDRELEERVQSTAVFARIRPHDKLRIVRALAARGEVTAMIGDGVNDAPALTEAHIGVAVGSATDIAKEGADLVLLDDDFGTVVAAIEQGRMIFDNVRKVIAYVLAGTFAEMIIIVTAMLLGWPAPLLVVQILWLNLICDGPSNLVLGFEPKEKGVMNRPPHSVREPLLSRLALALVVTIDLSSSAFALGLFAYFYLVLDDVVAGRSIVLASLAVNSMVYIFAYRSLHMPLWRMSPITANKPLIATVAAGLIATFLPFSVPAFGTLLGVTPLDWAQWGIVVSFAVVLLMTVELAKFVAVRTERPAEATR